MIKLINVNKHEQMAGDFCERNGTKQPKLSDVRSHGKQSKIAGGIHL